MSYTKTQAQEKRKGLLKAVYPGQKTNPEIRLCWEGESFWKPQM